MIKHHITTTIKDRGANRILKEIESVGSGIYFTTGIHLKEGSKVRRFKGRVFGKVPIAQYAFWNEYGTKTIPARPFMDTTVKIYTGDHLDDTARYLNRIYNGSMTSKKALTLQSKRAKRWMQTTINLWSIPANAPRTLRNKKKRGTGSSPLEDTLSMKKAITSQTHMSKGPTLGSKSLRRLLDKTDKKLMRIVS